MSASKDKEKARSRPGLGMRGELQGDILSFGIGSSVLSRFFGKKLRHDRQGAIASALSGPVWGNGNCGVRLLLQPYFRFSNQRPCLENRAGCDRYRDHEMASRIECAKPSVEITQCREDHRAFRAVWDAQLRPLVQTQLWPSVGGVRKRIPCRHRWSRSACLHGAQQCD